MQSNSTAIKVGIFTLAMLLVAAGLIVVFGEFRFSSTYTYHAKFSTASRLKTGQDVRIAGVPVGTVTDIALAPDNTVDVTFDVNKRYQLYTSTRALIRYENLVGDRFLEITSGPGDLRKLAPGATIAETNTQPALDLDALIGGFKPVFRALDPEKINTIASTIVTVFQGQGGTINDILEQTAQLTAHIADRDAAIGEVVKNLNVVLDTAVRHRQTFDETVDNFDKLVKGLNSHADPLANGTAEFGNAAGNLADLLADNRTQLHSLFPVAGPEPPDRLDDVDQILQKIPKAMKLIGRTGVYGDFFNFYLCDVTIKLPGLQPGGPVRNARLWQQPTGRCTPQ